MDSTDTSTLLKKSYFDNLLDAAVFSLEGIYEEDYLRKNYTSPTSKVRKVIKNLQDKGYIIKDSIVSKYAAVKYSELIPYQTVYVPVYNNQNSYLIKDANGNWIINPRYAETGFPSWTSPIYDITPIVTCSTAEAETK